MSDPVFRVWCEDESSATSSHEANSASVYMYVHFDGSRMGTKERMLREFATALNLPEWFGHNWDALVDILRDCWFGRTDRQVLVFHRRSSVTRTRRRSRL